MGAALSADDRTFPGAGAQQQRAQLLLISQQRAQLAAEQGWAPELVDGLGGVRATEQPDLKRTKVLKNPVHLKAKTLKLLQYGLTTLEECPRWDLCFTFDALAPCIITVTVGAMEGCAESLPLGAAWTSFPQRFQTPALGQEFKHEVDLGEFVSTQAPSLAFCVELRTTETLDSGAVADVGFHQADQGTGEAISDAETGGAEWTLGRFVNRGGKIVVELRTQRVHLAGTDLADTYEMHEVYGAEQHGPAMLGQDCVICMSETRDTAVLPCRHMCLCGSCAETMRSRVQYRSYRCPICRERVSSLLQISKAQQEGAADSEEGLQTVTVPPEWQV